MAEENHHNSFKPLYILGAFLLLSVFLFCGIVRAVETLNVNKNFLNRVERGYGK